MERAVRVSIEAQGPCAKARTYSVTEFEQHCGDWGFDLSDYDAAQLEFRDTGATAGAGYGNLVIKGPVAARAPPGPSARMKGPSS